MRQPLRKKAPLDLKRTIGNYARDYDLVVVIESPWFWTPVNPPTSTRTAFLAHDVGFHPEFLFKICQGYDKVFVSEEVLTPLFRERCGPSEWLPFGADEVMHRPHAVSKDFQIAFVAKVAPTGLYEPRFRDLEALRREFRVLATQAYRADMARCYSRAAVGYNRCMISPMTNMRVFEVLSCGAILLNNDGIKSVSRFFGSVPSLFRYDGDDSESIVEAAHNALDAFADRPDLGMAGRRAILAAHTYNHRALRLLRLSLGGNFEEPQRSLFAL